MEAASPISVNEVVPMNKQNVLYLSVKNKWLSNPLLSEKLLLTVSSLAYFLMNLIGLNCYYPLQNLPDSYNVISTAAFFSGTGNWQDTLRTISSFGQGLIYTPLFWIFKSRPLFLYRSFLVVNSIEITLIFPIAYKLCRKFWNCRVREAYVAALTAVLCLDLLSMSKFAWNEALVALMTWVCIYLCAISFIQQERTSRIKYSALFGLAVSFGYASHGRFIALVVGFSVCAVFLAFIRKNSVHLISYFSSLIPSFLLIACVDQYLVSHLYGQASGNLSAGISAIVQYIVMPFFWQNLFYTFVGQFSYLFWSTFGLGLLAIISILQSIRRAAKNRFSSVSNADALNLILFISAAFSYMMSLYTIASFLSGDIVRQQFYLHARYSINFYGPFILLGIKFLMDKKYSYRTIFSVLSVMLFFTALFAIFIFKPMFRGLSSYEMDCSFANIPFFQILRESKTSPKSILLLAAAACIFVTLFLLLNQFWKAFVKYLAYPLSFVLLFGFTLKYIASGQAWYHNTFNGNYQLIENSVSTDIDIYHTYRDLAPFFQFNLPEHHFRTADMQEPYENALTLYYELFFPSEPDSYLLTRNGSVVGPITIYAKGEAVKKEIEARMGEKLFPVTAETGITINGAEMKAQGGQIEGQSMRLTKRNAILYGPYARMAAGSYRVEISGENLQHAQYDVYNGQLFETDTLVHQEDKIIYEFSLEEYASELEFRIINQADEEISIQKITIYCLEKSI